MDKQVTSTPPIPGNGGGFGYLYLHYWPPVDREPAINVDMVNNKTRYWLYSPWLGKGCQRFFKNSVHYKNNINSGFRTI